MKLHVPPLWQTLAPREKRAVGAMLVIVCLTLVWWVLLAPAWKTLGSAPAYKAQLNADLQKMQTRADEIGRLKKTARPIPNRAQALTALQTVTAQHLGANATVSSQGEVITVSLQVVSAQALALWLQAVRVETGLQQRDMRIAQQTAPSNAANKGNAPKGWHGQVTLAFEGRGAT